MRAQAVLFDKDGTLFDFQKTWAGWVAGLIGSHADGDQQLADDLAEALGFDLTHELFRPDSIAIASTALQTAQKVVRFYPGLTPVELARQFDAAAEQVMPVEVLPLSVFLNDLLDAGLRLGIATNDSEASARKQLGIFELIEHFDYIAGYDSGHGAKPDAGMCSAFARHIGVEPEHVAMIGDSLHDLKAGRAAGMQCVGVLTGLATADDLAPFADVVLPDISHLQDWLNS